MSGLFFTLITLYALSSFAVHPSFLLSKRKYAKTGKLDTWFLFTLRVLCFHQICFLILFVAFLVLTGGYGLFGAPIIVFANTVVGVILFIVSAKLYKSYVKKILAVVPRPVTTVAIRNNSNRLLTILLSLFAIGIPLTLFALLNGATIANEFITVFAESTGNTWLVKKLPYEFEREASYKNIARNRQDITVCDNIETEIYRFECYTEADPEYTKYTDSCLLYTKMGDTEFADYDQTRCLMNKIYSALPSTKTSDAINCTNLVKDASGNTQLDYIMAQCAQLSLIQKARIKNDPEICNQILLQTPASEYDDVALKQAACLVHFHGSTQWKAGCNEYKDNEYFGINYDMLASCSSDTITPPDPDATKQYWFN